mgnify:CR=1 FL=1
MLARSTLAAWLTANQAGPEPSETRVLKDNEPNDGSTVHGARYLPASGGAEVLVYVVEGGGHTVPTRQYPVPPWARELVKVGNENRDIEGARHAWEFLSRHRLPPSAKEEQ